MNYESSSVFEIIETRAFVDWLTGLKDVTAQAVIGRASAGSSLAILAT